MKAKIKLSLQASFIEAYRDALSELRKVKKLRFAKNIEELEVLLDSFRKKKELMDSLGADTKSVSFHIESVISMQCELRLIMETLMCTPEPTTAETRRRVLNVNAILKKIIGRKEIKNHLLRIIRTFVWSPGWFSENFNNFILTGSSGVGKSTVARLIGEVFNASGLLIRSVFRHLTRGNFIAGFVGQTALKTRELLVSCLEGVAMVEEAYSLAPSKSFPGSDYASEALPEIVDFLDTYKGCGVVVMNGYPEKMQELLDFNEGISRRFPHTFHLEDMTKKQLSKMLVLQIKKFASIDKSDVAALDKYVYNTDFPKQGGDMLNLCNGILINTLGSDPPKGIDDYLQSLSGN